MDINSLEVITNIIVIISVIGSPIAYFGKRKLDKNANRNNAGHSILDAIRHIQANLNDNGKIKPICRIRDDGQKIKFHPMYIGYAGFQSAIHSGHYTLFSKHLQRILDDIYLRIELNNKTMDTIQELFLFSKQNNIKLGTAEYHDLMIDAWIQLTKIQNEILQYAQIFKDQLKEETKID